MNGKCGIMTAHRIKKPGEGGNPPRVDIGTLEVQMYPQSTYSYSSSALPLSFVPCTPDREAAA